MNGVKRKFDLRGITKYLYFVNTHLCKNISIINALEMFCNFKGD